MQTKYHIQKLYVPLYTKKIVDDGKNLDPKNVKKSIEIDTLPLSVR
jgi:hypothetical protein